MKQCLHRLKENYILSTHLNLYYHDLFLVRTVDHQDVVIYQKLEIRDLFIRGHITICS